LNVVRGFVTVQRTNEHLSVNDLNRDSQSDVQIKMHGLDLTSNE